MNKFVDEAELERLFARYLRVRERVLEGSLDTTTALERLQALADYPKDPLREKPLYKLLPQCYPLQVFCGQDFQAHLKKLIGEGFVETTFAIFDHVHIDQADPRPDCQIKRRLRLGQVIELCNRAEIVEQANQRGHILADIWDLLSMIYVLPLQSGHIFALGKPSLIKRYDGHPERIDCDMYIKPLPGAKWLLSDEEVRPKDSDHLSLSGDYVLFRDKPSRNRVPLTA